MKNGQKSGVRGQAWFPRAAGVGLAVMLIVSSAPGTSGQTLQEIQQQLQLTQRQQRQLQIQLDEAQKARDQQAARARDLEGQVRNLSGQEASLNAQVRDLSSRLAKLYKESRDVQDLRDQTQVQVQAAQSEIKRLSAIIEQQKRDVQTLMTLVDRERSNRYVKLLARADNIYDLMVKSRDLNSFVGQDLRVIDALNTNVSLLATKQTELQREVARLNAYQRQLVQKQTAIQQDRAALNNRVAQLRRTRTGQQVVLYNVYQVQHQTGSAITGIVSGIAQQRAKARALEQQGQSIRAQIAREARKRAEAERRRRLAAAQAAQAAQTGGRNTGDGGNRPDPTPRDFVRLPASIGAFTFPVAGGSIAGEFDGEYMTIRAPSAGAAVMAAQEGQVSEVRFVQANSGFTVVIAHTESLYTAYQNLQEPNVRIGQRVAAGTVIGNVGGGFLYPADELYFQVFRITTTGDAVPVNPRRFF
jgi:murein DD-endopeptidase MepM/ murein hydrolase activator NlpD